MTKTVLAYSHNNQNHVGELNYQDYHNHPKKNNAPISWRDVNSLRLSTAYDKEVDNTLLSFTPYVRDNSMDIIPNWSLSYDPSQYTTQNKSLGLLSKYRVDLQPLRTRLITGLDVDYSPGARISPSKTGTIYSRYTEGTKIYDYDVTFHSISPYIQGEISPSKKLRVTAGLRYDIMSYDDDNKLTDSAIIASGGSYGHAASTTVDDQHLNPKLGATYAFTDALNGFLALNHAVRTPSESQVFRAPRVWGISTKAQKNAQRAAQAALDLDPVTVDSLEAGLRGKQGAMDYEISVYEMRKQDDIVNYKHPVTGQTAAVNAGETLHQGVEAGLGADLATAWRIDSSLSYARHLYETWELDSKKNYNGKETETAPRQIFDTRLIFTPSIMNGGSIQL